MAKRIPNNITKSTILDRFGVPFQIDKKAGSLFQTPFNTGNAGRYRPRYYTTAQDYEKEVDLSTRRTIMTYSRQMYAQMGNIAGAIDQKAQWSFGTNWKPIYNGSNTAWGKQATDWLIKKWMPIANAKGGMFDFRTSLFCSSIAMDVDGDVLMVMVESKSGFPQIQFIEAHRIAQRDSIATTVTSGRYKGYRINAGVVLNDNDRPIAYNILGETEADDIFIPAQSAMLLFEPKHFSLSRGLSPIGTTLLDILDLQDIEVFIKQYIKLESTVGLIRKNSNGVADEAAGNIFSQTEDITNALGKIPIPPSAPAVEILSGGEIMYIDHKDDLVAFNGSNRPTSPSADFCKRIEQRVLFNLGWPYQLLHPDETGPGTRLIKEMAMNNVRVRQAVIERAARTAVSYAISKAMVLGLIPNNFDDDWYSWSFTKPAELSIDIGERSADVEDFKLGLITLDEIAAKNGRNAMDIRQESQVEVDDLLTRVEDIQKAHPTFNLDTVMMLMSQRMANIPPNIPEAKAQPKVI